MHDECTDELACLERAAVHYEIDGALAGPQGLYVDERSRFWICDSAAGRLAAFDASGKLVARIPFDGAVIGHMLGFAVTSSEAWLIGTGAQANVPPTLRAFSHDGKMVANVPLDPKATIMVPGRPDVFMYGGLRSGDVRVPRIAAGAIVFDPVEPRIPFAFQCEGEQDQGRLDTDSRSVSFQGCFSPLRMNKDGSLDSYLSLGGSRTVARFSKDGRPLATTTPPKPGFHIDIGFARAATGPSGQLYAVVPQRKSFEIVELGLPPPGS